MFKKKVCLNNLTLWFVLLSFTKYPFVHRIHPGSLRHCHDVTQRRRGENIQRCLEIGIRKKKHTFFTQSNCEIFFK